MANTVNILNIPSDIVVSSNHKVLSVNTATSETVMLGLANIKSYMSNSPAIVGGTANNTTLNSTVANNFTASYITINNGSANNISIISNTLTNRTNTILGTASYNTLTLNGNVVNCANGLNFNSNNFIINASNKRVSVNGVSSTSTFEVYGNTFIYGSQQPSLYIGNTTADYAGMYYTPSTKSAYLGAIGSSTKTILGSNNTSVVYISNNKVGIGNTNPQVSLCVDGNVRGNAAYFALQAYTQGSNQTSIGLTREGATANQKSWELIAEGSGSFRLRTINDAYTAASDAIVCTRGTGVTVASVSLKNYVYIDSNNNIGIGSTPPTNWGISGNINMNSPSVIMFNGTIGQVGVNAYYDGSSWRYQANGYSSIYYQTNGQNVWITANTGVSGNVVPYFTALTLDSKGNLLLRGDQGVTTGGGVFYMHEADAIPTTNPSNGGVLYVQGGSLKYRSPTGNVRFIANT